MHTWQSCLYSFLQLFQQVITVVRSKCYNSRTQTLRWNFVSCMSFPGELCCHVAIYFVSPRWLEQAGVSVWSVMLESQPVVKSCQEWQVIFLSCCGSEKWKRAHEDGGARNILRFCLCCCIRENWLVTQSCLGGFHPQMWVDVSQGYMYIQYIGVLY